MFGKNLNFLSFNSLLFLFSFSFLGTAQSIIGSWEVTEVNHFDDHFKDKIKDLQFHFFDNGQLIQESSEGYLLMNYQVEDSMLSFVGRSISMYIENGQLILDNGLSELSVKLILTPILTVPITNFSSLLFNAKVKKLGDIELNGIYTYTNNKGKRGSCIRFNNDFSFVKTYYNNNIEDALIRINTYYQFIAQTLERRIERENILLELEKSKIKKKRRRKNKSSKDKNSELPPILTPNASKKMLQLDGKEFVFRDTSIKKKVQDDVPTEYITVQYFSFTKGKMNNKTLKYRAGELISEVEREFIFIYLDKMLYWKPKGEPFFSAEISPRFFIPNNDSEEPIYRVSAHLPRFFSEYCENEALITVKYECAQEELSYFIDSNINYPEVAIANSTEGVVIIQFVINELGQISNPTIIKDIGDGCGEEGLRIVMQMNKEGLLLPGRDAYGNAIKTQFTLPINFRL